GKCLWANQGSTLDGNGSCARAPTRPSRTGCVTELFRIVNARVIGRCVCVHTSAVPVLRTAAPPPSALPPCPSFARPLRRRPHFRCSFVRQPLRRRPDPTCS